MDGLRDGPPQVSYGPQEVEIAPLSVDLLNEFVFDNRGDGFTDYVFQTPPISPNVKRVRGPTTTTTTRP